LISVHPRYVYGYVFVRMMIHIFFVRMSV
jgi:hypothetical protein